MRYLNRLPNLHLRVCCLIGFFAVAAFAQFPVKIPRLTRKNQFEKEQPLMTSFADAVTETPFLDDFRPSDLKLLSTLPRGPQSGFMITTPGVYTFSAQSYCCYAGTASPGRGSGYLYAPLKGTEADIMRNILRRAVNHPDIPQNEVQTLIWAILAQVKPSAANATIKSTMNVLLTPEEIDRLDENTFRELSDAQFSKAMGKLSAQTRQVFEAERQLRSALSRNAQYEELEKIAVLTSEPIPVRNGRAVPSGRWSYHPEGYFIRFYPSDYQLTFLDVYFPEIINVKRDNLSRIIAIEWTNGRTLTADYDDTMAPLSVAKEDFLKGYAFKSVQLKWTLPWNGNYSVNERMGRDMVDQWENAGWTFCGSLGGKGQTEGGGRYTEVMARYGSAKGYSQDLQKLLSNIGKLDKNRGIRATLTEESENLLNLMHFVSAIKVLLSEKGVDRGKLLFDPVELAQRAWAFELSELAIARESPEEPVVQIRPQKPDVPPDSATLGSKTRRKKPSPGGESSKKQQEGGSGKTQSGRISSRNQLKGDRKTTPEFNPEECVASAVDIGRQNLGISARPNISKCESDFTDCRNLQVPAQAARETSCLEGHSDYTIYKLCMERSEEEHDRNQKKCMSVFVACERR